MAGFLNKSGFLSGKSPQNERPQSEGQDIVLDPALYAGQWVLAADGNIFYSNGQEWVANMAHGVELLVPSWRDIPEGWFEVNADLGGELAGRKLISNKFSVNYVTEDTTSWLIIEKVNLYTDAERTDQVQSPPEPVGGITDTSGEGNHAYQNVSAERPIWQTHERDGQTFDQLYADSNIDHVRIPVPTNPFEGSAVLCFGTGSANNAEDVAASVHVQMYSEEGYIKIQPHKFPLEEVIIFDRFLTATEAEQLIRDLVDQRKRTDQNPFHGMTDASSLFDGFRHLSGLPPLDFSSTTIIDAAFRQTSISTIPSYDFSNVTNAGKAFKSSSIGSLPDLDFGSLEDAGELFRYAGNLESLPSGLRFPSLVSAARMFSFCASLPSFPSEAGSAIFPVCDEFDNTWEGCKSFTGFPPLDLSAGKIFSATWRDCTSLTEFGVEKDDDGNIIAKLNISSGEDFTQAWMDCESLTSFPDLDFSSAVTLAGAWRNCTGLTSFPAIDTSNVVDFGGVVGNGAWQGCSGLTSFPTISLSSADTLTSTWQGCSGLTSFPLLDTSGVRKLRKTWSGCDGLTDFPKLDCSNVESAYQAWLGCTGLTSFPSIDFPVCTVFNGTWHQCSSLTTFPQIDVSNGENFQSAWNSTGLTGFPALDFSSVVDGVPGDGDGFHDSWYNCGYLSDFPVGVFDNARTRNYYTAFTGCALTETSVDNILVSVQTMLNNHNGDGSLDTGQLDIDGGTNATPSSTGKAAADDLRNNHNWTVNLNGY